MNSIKKGVKKRNKRNQRLTKAYLDVVNKPEHNCWAVKPLDAVDNFELLTAFDAIIYGAPGSPYEYGTFDVHIDAKRYPHRPPKVTFKTLVYHICINPGGKTCLGVVEGWRKDNTLRDVLNELYAILRDNPLEDLRMLGLTIHDSALSCLLEDANKYDKVARLYTIEYAMARVCFNMMYIQFYTLTLLRSLFCFLFDRQR